MRSFKSLAIGALLFALVCFLLDAALYPCTFIRNDVHALVSGEKVDDLYLGTSHGKFNIDPASVEAETGRRGHNAANGNEYPVDSYYLLRLMVEKGRAPKRVIYVTTPEYFLMDKGEANNALLFYHEFPLSLSKAAYFFDVFASKSLRSALFPWHEYALSRTLPAAGENLRKKLTGDYDISDFVTEEQQYHEDGHIAHAWVSSKDFTFGPGESFSSDKVLPENLLYLRKLIALCKKEGIAFAAVLPPTAGAVLDRYQESYEEADAFFTSFFEEEEVPFYNFNAGELYKLFTHDISAYTDLDGHLCQDAAWDFSKVLSQVLSGI